MNISVATKIVSNELPHTVTVSCVQNGANAVLLGVDFDKGEKSLSVTNQSVSVARLPTHDRVLRFFIVSDSGDETELFVDEIVCDGVDSLYVFEGSQYKLLEYLGQIEIPSESNGGEITAKFIERVKND